MFRKQECVAMLLAGGQGSRLYALTSRIAKPAVPYGGKYRIIDFPLSNCVNSGIETVGVLTQYQPLELNDYIGSGQPWDLDRMDAGVHVLPPYQRSRGADWYKGTANAIYQNLAFIERYDPESVSYTHLDVYKRQLRVCGVDKKVGELTLAELKTLRLLDSAETIPTFEEFLQLVDGRVPLIVEIKMAWMNAEVCPAAQALLDGYRGVYCVESFNPLALRWYKKNRPRIARGLSLIHI